MTPNQKKAEVILNRVVDCMCRYDGKGSAFHRYWYNMDEDASRELETELQVLILEVIETDDETTKE